MDSSGINVKDRASMDELCNFEASRMYASVDNNGEAKVSTGAHVDAGNEDLSTGVSHQEYSYEKMSHERWHVVGDDQSMRTPTRVLSDNMSVSPMQTHSSHGSLVSDDASCSTVYSGSPMSGDDFDECNSYSSQNGPLLMSGKEFEENSLGNTSFTLISICM
jgi:hypothetical protein